MQAAHRPDCSGHVYSGPGGEATHEECSTSLTWWIVAFSFAQFGLSQFKDFHSIWCGQHLPESCVRQDSCSDRM